ncbi:MAG: hypothetical protein GXO43_06340 [Crenarchaeota archaeon]|nr:hypothetical protein [Thermoproteota archaeon]
MQILDMKLSTVYRVFKALKEKQQLLVSEVIAIAGSTAFYDRYMPYLEDKGYIVTEKKRVANRYIRVVRLTEKGKKLLELLEEIDRLDKRI